MPRNPSIQNIFFLTITGGRSLWRDFPSSWALSCQQELNLLCCLGSWTAVYWRWGTNINFWQSPSNVSFVPDSWKQLGNNRQVSNEKRHIRTSPTTGYFLCSSSKQMGANWSKERKTLLKRKLKVWGSLRWRKKERDPHPVPQIRRCCLLQTTVLLMCITDVFPPAAQRKIWLD